MHGSHSKNPDNTEVPDSWKSRAAEAAEFIKNRIDGMPRTGLLMGTGLGEATAALEVAAVFPYRTIPHFPLATVQGHAGQLLFGAMEGRTVLVMQGRFHLYEGYSPAEVTFPIRVMQTLGVRRIVLTNAAGGVHPEYAPGSLMLITDHINLTGENPLIGPNENGWGPRFPDMTSAYDPQLTRQAEFAGRDAGLMLHRGVYAGLKGPSLETPAETRFLRAIGADAVGFSTVQEVLASVHGGMKVLGISVITNCNDPDRPAPATVEEIIRVAHRAAPDLEKLIRGVLRQVDDDAPR
jgi:purine-nucleoside phosphorylase